MIGSLYAFAVIDIPPFVAGVSAKNSIVLFPLTLKMSLVSPEFLTLKAISVDKAPCALTSSLTVVDGVAPTPKREFVLSQNKLDDC
jgi:hypothetical protein